MTDLDREQARSIADLDAASDSPPHIGDASETPPTEDLPSQRSISGGDDAPPRRPPAALPVDAPPRDPGLATSAGRENHPLASEAPLAYVSLGLTVGDGFKFGCGLALALTLAGLCVFVLLSALFLAASVVGVPVPLGR